ncbi:MAG: hypothetical protein ABR922_03295, partial [Streptosporangiaceae bacterium]
RPGKVAGAHTPQDGLNYWVRRAARRSRTAVPGDPAQPIQIIDVRDLARWCNCCIRTRPAASIKGRPRRGGIEGGMSWQRLTQRHPAPYRRPITPRNPGRQRPTAALRHPAPRLCQQMLPACSLHLPH